MDLGKTRNEKAKRPQIKWGQYTKLGLAEEIIEKNPFQRSRKLRERVIILGRIPVPEFPIGHHWALKIGDMWWEIYGDNTKNPNDNFFEFHYDVYLTDGSKAHSDVDKTFRRVGTTNLTDWELYSFSKSWIESNPKYNFLTKNCQDYATDLVRWATRATGNYNMPPTESPISLPEQKFEIGNSGAYAELDLGKVELIKEGPVKMRARLNADTGFKAKDDNVEVSVLGLGFKAGKDGVGLKFPTGDFNLCFW